MPEENCQGRAHKAGQPAGGGGGLRTCLPLGPCGQQSPQDIGSLSKWALRASYNTFRDTLFLGENKQTLSRVTQKFSLIGNSSWLNFRVIRWLFLTIKSCRTKQTSFKSSRLSHRHTYTQVICPSEHTAAGSTWLFVGGTIGRCLKALEPGRACGHRIHSRSSLAGLGKCWRAHKSFFSRPCTDNPPLVSAMLQANSRPIQCNLFRFIFLLINSLLDFPGGAVVENPPANAGNRRSSPGPGRFHTPRSN